jgi:hypothetical protein
MRNTLLSLKRKKTLSRAAVPSTRTATKLPEEKPPDSSVRVNSPIMPQQAAARIISI